MANKKIVFIIVEGPSDEDALGVLFNKIFDNSKVYIHVIHGDITTKHGNNPSNILKKVTAEVQQYTKNYHFGKSNFQQIIHIMDTDGAYITNEAIVENECTERPVYSTYNITTHDRENLINRNMVKRDNMDKLIHTKTIWGSIP